ncbi:unnamed protein product [Paramecium sonneborni]|uniref:Uncharacterized protein n=1 Tax=Paramecium sonneborni TaxID=65129 RepID=A0A8S1QYK8_9CILI|nr:unnamed protein product [Paramecium sonneborni]
MIIIISSVIIYLLSVGTALYDTNNIYLQREDNKGLKRRFNCNLDDNSIIYFEGNDSYVLQYFTTPQHTWLRLEVVLYVESKTNQLEVYIDNNLVLSNKTQPQQGVQYCQNMKSNYFNNMNMINYKIEIQHSGNNVLIIFVGKMSEGWGISNLTLSVQKCPDGCVICGDGDRQDQCQVWLFGFKNLELRKYQELNIDGWNVENGKNQTSICGIEVYGGYNNFGSKTILSKQFIMKPHFKVRIQVQWVKIDSWDNEQGQMLVDGTVVWKNNYTNSDEYGIKVCGNLNENYKTVYQNIDITVDHTGKYMLLQFKSTLDQAADDESFGLTDLYIYYLPCADQCDECSGPQIQDCIKCSNNQFYDSGQCYNIQNFVELESDFMSILFNNLNDWKVYGSQKENFITDCAGFSLVGGFEVMGNGGYITKKFQIPPHTRLRLQVLLYKIDSWDDEKFIIEVDDAQIWTHSWFVDTDSYYCGQMWADSKIFVDVIFQHTNQEATIKFTTTLNQDAVDESWGFREFNLMYESVPVIELISSATQIFNLVLLIFFIYF